MCFRCVSVLRYLTDHISALGLGVLARLVTTHDTPGLVAAAIQSQPWTRESGAGPQVTRDTETRGDQHCHYQVWRDGMWHRNDENLTVEKMEFVTWICLYNLLSCKVDRHSTMTP